MAKILVIDDSPSALETAEIILENAGHQVRSCTNAKRAIQILSRATCDLILTDIYMPDQDGLELIRTIRQTDPSVPIVAMSGASGRRNVLNVAKCLGAREVVLKPFSNADLLDAVQRALTSH